MDEVSSGGYSKIGGGRGGHSNLSWKPSEGVGNWWCVCRLAVRLLFLGRSETVLVGRDIVGLEWQHTAKRHQYSGIGFGLAIYFDTRYFTEADSMTFNGITECVWSSNVLRFCIVSRTTTKTFSGVLPPGPPPYCIIPSRVIRNDHCSRGPTTVRTYLQAIRVRT